MSRIAFIFPGQGAQAVGMGRELAEAFPAARAIFEEVDAALGETLSATIWEGPAEALQLTANAQPALMAVSLAAMAALKADFGIETDVQRSSPDTRWANTARFAQPGRFQSAMPRGSCASAGRRCRRRSRSARVRWRR